MIKYSIHTLQLQTKIDPNEYMHLCSILYDLPLSVQNYTTTSHKQQNYINDFWIYRNFPYYGINSITLLINIRPVKNDSPFTNYYLYINVNPYNALHKCRHSDANIIEPWKIKEAMNITLLYLNQLFSQNIVRRLSLNRLDFCADLIFSSQVQADEYIKLLKKGIPPKALSEKLHPDPVQHRMVPYKDALLLECGSYSFEVYTKYRQMAARKMKNPDTAAGIIRLELRTLKRKINHLAEKYNIPYTHRDYMELLIHAPDISKQEISHRISTMVGEGCFYSYQKVITKIEDADYKITDIELMKQIIKYISKHSSCPNLLDDLNISRKKWKKLLQKFDNLKCSPVPVPRTFNTTIYPGVSVWESTF